MSKRRPAGLSILIFICFFYSCGNSGRSDGSTIRPTGQSIPRATAADTFQPKSFTNSHGQQMRYLLFVPPSNDPQKRYPLVLWLHGGGSRGDDLAKITSYGDQHGPLFFAKPENQLDYGCIIVAPLCPSGQLWSNSEAEEPSIQTRLVFEILEEVQAKYKVDSQRLYVIGISMGGYGTWELIARRPEKFAAAVPICGGGNPNQAARIKSVPLWVFHGEKDDQVNVTESRKMVEAVRQAGGIVKYTEYRDVGHMAWERAFREPDFLSWLFSQKRS